MSISEIITACFVLVAQVILYFFFFKKTTIGVFLMKEAELRIVKMADELDTKAVLTNRDETVRVIEYTVVHHPISENTIQEVVALAGELSNYGYSAVDVLKDKLEK